MSDEVIMGIYKIISPSQRIYIGQSVDILHRFKTYIRMYTKNKHQTKLHRSFIKYGVDTHTFEIIEVCNELELNEKERHWQDFYDVLNNGLNCNLTKTNDKSGKVSTETLIKMSIASTGNQHWKGKKHTEESKEKIRLSKIGKKYSDEVNKKKGRKGSIPPLKGIFSKDHPLSKPLNQYTIDGLFVAKWDCLMDVKRELGFSIGNISSCLTGKLKTSNKFIWKYI
jgi:group I intron endonuclease